MRLPLLLLHNIDNQFNNWALLLPPVRIMQRLTAFAAACMLCRPQLRLNAFVLAQARLALARSQSHPLLSYRQRSRVCSSSGLTGILSLRLAIPPRNFSPPRPCDVAKCIRGRVGGLLMLAFLAPEDLYSAESVDGVEECSVYSSSVDSRSSNCSDVSSSASRAGCEDASSCSGSSSYESAFRRPSTSRSKRRKK
jgi:hypothetical protein